jgi:replication initiation and membrane attachment protein
MTDDRTYQVDVDLLRLNLNKLIHSGNNINILQNIKLNRNTKMFIQHFSTDQLTHVFSDYMTLNSEQYLRAIVKSNLTQEQLTTIKTLKEKYALSDYVINLLIDYTLFKTNGSLNEKYIVKVANTINGLGLKSLSQIYDHFHFVNTIQQTTAKDPDQTSLVEWSDQE